MDGKRTLVSGELHCCGKYMQNSDNSHECFTVGKAREFNWNSLLDVLPRGGRLIQTGAVAG